MIVADLFRKDVFPDFRLISGTEGIKREISAVSVIDSPDVDRWMRGGEFLIGSGYIFKENPEEMTPFLKLVATRDIAAMGIKMDRYITTLPESLVNEGEKFGIPLIEIPLKYRWVDIIEIVHRILMREKLLLENEGDNSLYLWNESWDIKRLVTGLSYELQRDIFVKVPELELEHLFQSEGLLLGNISGASYSTADVIQETELPQKGNICVSLQERYIDNVHLRAAAFTLRSDTNIEIHLRLLEDEHRPSIYQERMILRAITLLRASVIETRVLSYETHAQKERFLENLCLGTYNNQEVVLARANELGLEIPSNIVVAEIASIERKTLPLWKPNYPLTFQIANQWVSIIDTAILEKDLEKLSRIAIDHKLWITLGPPVTGWNNFCLSYEDAKRALAWVREFEPLPDVYRYGELALYTFLNKAIKLPEASGLWQRFWSPMLHEPPNRRAVPLVEVAQALIKADFNQKLCADMLHLHYNTARNYIAELEELLHIDLTKRFHRMALVLSFCIHTSKEKDHWEDLI